MPKTTPTWDSRALPRTLGRTAAIIFAVTTLLALAPVPAHADSTNEALAKIKGALLCTKEKTCTDKQEYQMIYDAGKAVIDDDKSKGKTIKGNAGLDGFPVDGVIPAEFLVPGSTNVLTFDWLNPQTLLETTGPDIAAVSYAYSQTPDDPTSFTFLGLSTDASSDFALSFTAFSMEEAIVATPYDAAGNPIYITDVDGSGNLSLGVAVDLVAPEPSTFLLLASGLLPLLRMKRK